MAEYIVTLDTFNIFPPPRALKEHIIANDMLNQGTIALITQLNRQRRSSREIDWVGKTLPFEYTDDGTERFYKKINGDWTRIVYNAKGQETNYTDNTGVKWNITYNDNGDVLVLDKFNGVSTSYQIVNTYDAQGRLLFSSDSAGFGRAITYIDAERKKTVQNTNGVYGEYIYDTQDRLIYFATKKYFEHYTYDENGNRRVTDRGMF